VRIILEKTYSTSKRNDDLQQRLITFYGLNLFKCPRISCKFFVGGFSTKQARNQHIEKHKRPFTCPYPGCPLGTLGFTLVRDLNRHLASSHEARQYDETQFPIVQDPKDINIKRAIKTGSIREVEKWLEQFSRTPGNTPFSTLYQEALLAAVKKGDEFIFKLLLDSVPNIATKEINLLLCGALSQGQNTITYILLDYPQADPFDQNSGTWECPMAIAIRLGRIDVLKHIDNGKTVNWDQRIMTSDPGENEWSTPLSLAIRSGG
jgi:hypothetical protein